ncbi:hypothetical protein [Burkholderia sp. JKS000303]|uniref:hypothetical protein n=1 Tax=Burkholderia sp. JKS000303 TaxID=1938747 RepID=UPI000BFA9443|nr:hypothetical protein [Burkholderia sp. JKS000303]PFH12879.1 hypothetical protein BX604_7299 [Burkholderia sp. JKS000303]
MHPKAVTLMLAGFEPFRFKSRGAFVRVMRTPYEAFAYGLIYSDCWEYNRAPQPSEYEPIDWSAVPCSVWDALPDELLQRAIEGA